VKRDGTAGLSTISFAFAFAIMAAVYSVGAFICHQRPERSFHRKGAQLPVCARCTGLYLGGTLGALGWIALAGARRSPTPPSRRMATAPVARRALAVAAIPTAITIATAWIGLWDPGNLVRAAIALPLGASIGAIVSAVAAGDLR
jgi:uncharacterized membrane protein